MPEIKPAEPCNDDVGEGEPEDDGTYTEEGDSDG